MYRLFLAFGLIAAGAWPSLQTEKIEAIDNVIPASIPDVDLQEKPSPFVFANYVSNEAPVEAPATTEDCVCENCDCENCVCEKTQSGWQSTQPASSAGSYAGSNSAGSYASSAPAASAGSYAASSAGSYGARSAPAASAGSYGARQEVHQVAFRPARRVAAAVLRPFQRGRERRAARRAGRHASHSAHAPASGGACSGCN